MSNPNEKYYVAANDYAVEKIAFLTDKMKTLGMPITEKTQKDLKGIHTNLFMAFVAGAEKGAAMERADWNQQARDAINKKD